MAMKHIRAIWNKATNTDINDNFNEIYEGKFLPDNIIDSGKLAKDSVGTDNLKKESVGNDNLKNKVITSEKIDDDVLENRMFKNEAITLNKLMLKSGNALFDVSCRMGNISSFDGNYGSSNTLMASNEFLNVKKGDYVLLNDKNFLYCPFLYDENEKFISSKGSWESGTYTFQFDCLVKFTIKYSDNSTMINTQLLNISKILSVPNLDIKIISDPEQIKNKTIEKEHLNFDVISDIEDNSLTGKVFEDYSIASSKINWSDNLFLSGMTCVLGTFSAITGKLEYRETIMATIEFLEVKKGDTIEILDDRFWFVPYLWNLDGTYNSSKAAWESGTYTFQFDCLVKIVVKLTDSSSDIKKYLNDIDKILSLPNNDIKYITNSSQIKDNVIEKNNLAFEIDNKSRLNNKKWATLGDSITARGWYQEAIKNESGINFINFGLGGSTITKNTGYNVKSFTERMIDLPDELDFLTIWGGVNDFGFGKFGYVQGSALGDFDSRDDTTFFGALHKIFEYVIPKYKNKNTKIGFIVTTPVSKELGMFDKNAKGFYLADYCDAAKKVCEYYSIPYLDFQKNSGISELNVDVMTSTFDGGSSDGLHPSKIWIELKKYSILNFLESL